MVDKTQRKTHLAVHESGARCLKPKAELPLNGGFPLLLVER
jgi:hypothetical protein